MGRRALVIVLASFLVIAVGAAVVWAILSSQTPTAGPTPQPTDPDPTATASASPTPSASPTSTGTPVTPAPAPITALAAAPTPKTVQLSWAAPPATDLEQVVVVRSTGSAIPNSPENGTIVAAVPPTQTSIVDAGAGLAAGGTYTYGVFARSVTGQASPAAGISVTLPAALTITPVKMTGDLTQQPADATLTDSGSFAFTAFSPTGPRTVGITPASGNTGTLTTTLTEPAGGAAGAVAWTYAVQNATVVPLAEGAKRVETFTLALRDGVDQLPATVTVTLHGINDAPTALVVPLQTGIAGEPFSFPIPADTFHDPDTTDTLTLSTGALPAWLTFANGTLSGQPGATDAGLTSVTVIATDPHGATASAEVSIDIVAPLPAPNQPPAPFTDQVVFDLGVDPLQTTAQLLANDVDPDGAPNPLSAIPASAQWLVNDEVAGSYTIDAEGLLTLDSGVVADGPLQRLGAGEQVTATILYSVTDGVDTVEAQADITVIGAPLDDGEYGVSKVLALPPGPGRGLSADRV